VRIRKGDATATEPFADNVVVDLDRDGQVLGLELLLPREIEDEIKIQIKKAI
jgi:uncharacterized protein YuzE